MGAQFGSDSLSVTIYTRSTSFLTVNWARKRKPEWMATTGRIHYVRERTVESQERELGEKKGERQPETSPAPVKEIVREPPTEIPIKTNVERKESNTYWPRKMRSDITRSRVV